MNCCEIREIDSITVAHKLSSFRAMRPLVHCITNEVVQEITANVLLASGASPAMVVGEGETEFFASVASALSINVGTPYNERIKRMEAAIKGAKEAGKPWVLDPVAAGGMSWRDEIIFRLLELGPSAVRGNASEIRFLAGSGQGGTGVDSIDSSDSAIEAAIAVARRYNTLVTVTGETDYATDGKTVVKASGGNPMMTLVVGTGCSLSSLLAGFLAAGGLTPEPCASCCAYVNRASEQASQLCRGPGSFHTHYLDALYLIRPEDFTDAEEI